MRRRKAIIPASALVLAGALAVFNYYSRQDASHQAIQFYLRLYGAGIYEYHAQTGRWPTCPDDLAVTSLPRRTPYWKALLQDEVDVIVWHPDLKPDPKDNAGVLLAYHNKGLYARLGRVWVCWGDLRTEYIRAEDLQAHLPGRGG
jgi:hypothetical protein